MLKRSSLRHPELFFNAPIVIRETRISSRKFIGPLCLVNSPCRLPSVAWQEWVCWPCSLWRYFWTTSTGSSPASSVRTGSRSAKPSWLRSDCWRTGGCWPSSLSPCIAASNRASSRGSTPRWRDLSGRHMRPQMFGKVLLQSFPLLPWISYQISIKTTLRFSASMSKYVAYITHNASWSTDRCTNWTCMGYEALYVTY